MRLLAIAAVSLALFGCGKMNDAGTWAKRQVTFGPPAPPEESAEEKAARLEKERQEAHARLQSADQMVQAWTDRLGEKQPNGGFAHHEGLTEPDPWGNLIKVGYVQNWFNETMTVKSAGPDGKFDTPDDLVRARTVANPAGIVDGVSNFGWCAIAWVSFGAVSLILANDLKGRRSRLAGKRVHREHPAVFVFVVLLLAPLAFLFYGCKAVANVFGRIFGNADLGLGWDFGLDFDLPSFDLPDIDLG